jgi:hypothetical protein
MLSMAVTKHFIIIKFYLIFEVSDTMHLFSMDERKTNLMYLLYIFIVAVGDALHVSGVFAHRPPHASHHHHQRSAHSTPCRIPMLLI